MIDKHHLQLLGSYIIYVFSPFSVLVVLYIIWSLQTDQFNNLKKDQHLITTGLLQYQYNLQIKDHLNKSRGYSCFDSLNERLTQEIIWQCIKTDESDAYQSKTFMTAKPLLLSENDVNNLMEWASSCRLNNGCYDMYPVVQQMSITPSIDVSFYLCELTVKVSSVPS
jgi:hypothetical protein